MSSRTSSSSIVTGNSSTLDTLIASLLATRQDLTLSEGELDKLISDAIVQDAKAGKDHHKTIATSGLSASIPDPTKAASTNKRFLAGVIRGIEGHNAAIVKRRLREALQKDKVKSSSTSSGDRDYHYNLLGLSHRSDTRADVVSSRNHRGEAASIHPSASVSSSSHHHNHHRTASDPSSKMDKYFSSPVYNPSLDVDGDRWSSSSSSKVDSEGPKRLPAYEGEGRREKQKRTKVRSYVEPSRHSRDHSLRHRSIRDDEEDRRGSHPRQQDADEDLSQQREHHRRPEKRHKENSLDSRAERRKKRISPSTSSTSTPRDHNHNHSDHRRRERERECVDDDHPQRRRRSHPSREDEEAEKVEKGRETKKRQEEEDHPRRGEHEERRRKKRFNSKSNSSSRSYQVTGGDAAATTSASSSRLDATYPSPRAKGAAVREWDLGKS